MEQYLRKGIIAIVIVILVVVLALLIKNNFSKKDNTKKADQQQETKKGEEEKKDTGDDGEIELPSDIDPERIKATIKCTYEGDEYNVIWEKSYVIFNNDANNKVIKREDVREYKFERVDIDEYINNKTLTTISNVLNGLKGINSTLSTIDQKEHTYRFTTIFNFDDVNQDDLYNYYYKRFYNTGDIKMSREQFDERYKSLDYDAMVKAYLDAGYTCK
jgi:hypothetical protein